MYLTLNYINHNGITMSEAYALSHFSTKEQRLFTRNF